MPYYSTAKWPINNISRLLIKCFEGGKEGHLTQNVRKLASFVATKNSAHKII